MTVLHPALRQIAKFLRAMPEVFRADIAYVMSLAGFAGVAFRMVGVPVVPALVIGLCIGGGIVAFLTAGADRL